MYFPYMRCKQYELTALKEVANEINNGKVCPLLEPVNKKLKPLYSAVNDINGKGFVPHIILNPDIAEWKSDDPQKLSTALQSEGVDYVPCIRFNDNNAHIVTPFLDVMINSDIVFSLCLKEDVSPSHNKYLSASSKNFLVELDSFTNAFSNSLANVVIINNSFPAKARNADYSTSP